VTGRRALAQAGLWRETLAKGGSGLTLLAFILALAPPAIFPDHVGRLYSYVRSNSDGSEAERVYVYRASRTRIEVAKMRTTRPAGTSSKRAGAFPTMPNIATSGCG
jgi:hypothetical protein